MGTPREFEGIFYSPNTGSDEIFDYGDEMVNILNDSADRLFLIVGAVIDLRFNGFQHRADAILHQAKKLWPEEDWLKVETVLTKAHTLKNEGKDGWQKAVYETAQAVRPSKFFLPEEYKSVFVDREIMSMVFSLRAQAVDIIAGASSSAPLVALIIMDLHLNGQLELANEIETRSRELWPIE